MQKKHIKEHWVIHCISKDDLPKTAIEWDKFLTTKKITAAINFGKRNKEYE
jgi:hypothetical protein